jgi:hypothetical protein
MRIRDADNFALVLENEHVLDLRHTAEFVVLFLPGVQQLLNLIDRELSESEVVFGTVANYACDSSCRTILIEACGRFEHGRCSERHTRMIVIENVCLLIFRIDRAADARVAGTEITVRDVRR